MRCTLTVALAVVVAAWASSPVAQRQTHAQVDPAICGNIPFADNVVLVWNEAALNVIRQSAPMPTVASRSLAILNTAMYDAWAAYDGAALATMTFGAWRRPVSEHTAANKRKAVSFAAYVALSRLFTYRTPEGLVNDAWKTQCFAPIMRRLGYDPAALSEDLRTSEGVGSWAGRTLMAYRENDGSNQLGDVGDGIYPDYTNYVAVNPVTTVTGTFTMPVDPNRWQPLRVLDRESTGACATATSLYTQYYFTPHWGLVAPFALDSGETISPTVAPPLHPDLEYEIQTREIISLSAALDDHQKLIAEYWEDGRDTEQPPGHWHAIGQYVSRRDAHTLDQDVRMFFALSNATFDAGILAWRLKRQFDYARPITAVRFLFNGQQIRAWGGPGQNATMVDGATWKPYQSRCVVTPPFPEYVSGHSTFSAASAEVLRSFTGSDAYGGSATFVAGSSRFENGITPSQTLTLTWPTFTAAADEAGMSRRFGGIHFRTGDLMGREIGKKVGQRAWLRTQAYISGTLTLHPAYLPLALR
jgi:hypothetical protein